ncbi:hypothetical protein [Tenggerimyces flavus]|uniref:Uncharacterized protein n=1 Tax=Tenggerimyces flavus TaxID=1708749 RepID=A0ABV7Y8Z4_9ACTN|nr:hypothetical protein [Tenggerimyces flavus]MBM7791001.1 hypothetical protein [Tenggerimyces flavus]
MSEKRDTRRAVLTGGAVLLGAAVVGGAAEGTAEAANGGALLIGRANAGSAETKLSNASTVPGLSVTSTNAAGGARAASLIAKGGYGAYIESTSNHAASIWAKHKDKWGIFSVNGATTRGTGGAFRADGRQNQGLFATTANKTTTAITARNTGAGAGYVTASAINGTAGPTADADLKTAITNYWAGAGSFAGANGVLGVATESSGYAVVGVATKPNAVGLKGIATSPAVIGLSVSGRSDLGGDARVFGTLSKTAGSFKIDHPLDPANKYLSHSFVESPDMMNVYNGNVIADAKGEATVELADWFEALNRDFRYQLTPIGGAAPDLHIKREVEKGRFSIAGAKPGQKLSWQLTGIRQDAYAEAHRIPVEEVKSAQEKGKYVFPKGFGKPNSASVAAHR